MNKLTEWNGKPVWFAEPVNIFPIANTEDSCKLVLLVDVEREFAELKAENARLILHTQDIEKCNDNCQTKIAELEAKLNNMKKKSGVQDDK